MTEVEDFKKITEKAVKEYKPEPKAVKEINIDHKTEVYLAQLKAMRAMAPGSPYRYLTDDRNGELFAKLVKDKLCYVASTKRPTWLMYNGSYWEQCEGVGLEARAFLRALYIISTKEVVASPDFMALSRDVQRDYKKQQQAITGAYYPKKLETVAKDYLAKSRSELDTNKDLLNLKNGTYDLKAKKLREHRPSDFITMEANVEYDGKRKDIVWDKFINDITCNDKELASFLQKKLGSALTGHLWTEDFQICYGEKTRNGKGTLLGTVQNLLGTYAVQLDANVIMHTRKPKDGQEASPEVAKMAGKRFVVITEAGDKNGSGILDTEKLKSWSGNDSITARTLYGDPITFDMQGHIWSQTNTLASVLDTTIFDSYRCNVIPFSRYFSEDEADKNIKQYFYLPTVKTAILNWLIAGYKKAEKEGWKTEKPKAVIAATEDYKETEDLESQWLNDVLEGENGAEMSFKEAMQLYKMYSNLVGSKPLKYGQFSRWLMNNCDYIDDHKAGRRIIGYKPKSSFLRYNRYN